MATIEKRGDGYRVRWRDPDGKARSRQCPSLKTAKALERSVEDAAAKGLRWEPAVAREEPDIQALMRAWITDLARYRAAATVMTTVSALSVWERWLLLRCNAAARRSGSVDLGALSYQMLSDYHEDLAGFEGVERADSSRRYYLGVVARLWKWAWDHDYAVPRPKALKLRTPDAVTTMAPTWAQCDAMIAATKSHASWVHTLAVICRYTGLRSGQANRLTWGDVDLHDGTITIRPELGKTRAERSGRILPISRHLVTFLAGLGRREGRIVDHNVSSDGFLRQPFKEAWGKTDAAPDIYRKRPLHALRKAFASECERRGVNRESVEYYLGHDLGIRGVYVDPRALRLREVADAVAVIGSTPTLPDKAPEMPGSERVPSVSLLDAARAQVLKNKAERSKF